jgi:hypothetical protein
MYCVLSFDVGIRHLAYCRMEHDDNNAETRILEWELIDLGKADDIETAIDRLIVQLHARFSFESDTWNSDVVIIERQPQTRSVMMVALQMALCSFFTMAKVQAGRVKDIRFGNAKHKLSMQRYAWTAEDAPREVRPRKEGGGAKQKQQRQSASRYAANKRYAINAAKHYLTFVLKDELNAAKLALSKKKDDLSDSFLQGMALLERRAFSGAV